MKKSLILLFILFVSCGKQGDAPSDFLNSDGTLNNKAIDEAMFKQALTEFYNYDRKGNTYNNFDDVKKNTRSEKPEFTFKNIVINVYEFNNTEKKNQLMLGFCYNKYTGEYGKLKSMEFTDFCDAKEKIGIDSLKQFNSFLKNEPLLNKDNISAIVNFLVEFSRGNNAKILNSCNDIHFAKGDDISIIQQNVKPPKVYEENNALIYEACYRESYHGYIYKIQGIYKEGKLVIKKQDFGQFGFFKVEVTNR